MAYAAVSIFLALCVAGSGATPTMDELKQALSTHDAIWIVNRTFNPRSGSDQHQCVYVEIGTLMEDRYDFTQHYWVAGQWHSNRLYAKLKDRQGTDGQPGFLVNQKEGQETGRLYILQYWDGNNRCGILKVALGGEDHYELHVWNEQVARVPRSCEEEYKKLTLGRKQFKLYSYDCANKRVAG
uniref:Lipocalin-3 1 n=1 Tax=Amblyomma cajennense TaxID=34607 RepID=A0A023FRT2_AMBCJ